MRDSCPSRHWDEAACRLRRPDMTFCAREPTVRAATASCVAHSRRISRSNGEHRSRPALLRAPGTAKMVEDHGMYYN